MRTVLTPAATKTIMANLQVANAAVAAAYPGEDQGRQPVHTVYGGAHLFRRDSAVTLAAAARRAFTTYAPDAATFAAALGLAASDPARDSWLAAEVHARVKEKLDREAVEDFRIDFEDGFGVRSDREEDDAAAAAAVEVARGHEQGTLPPFLGLRVKTLSEEQKERAVRTLDIFVTTLVAESTAKGAPSLFVTLPKVVAPAQVEAFVAVLELLESAHALPPGALRLEIMVEATQSLVAPDGSMALPQFVRAGRGRITGAHFGAYDYTAACSITAAHQDLAHQACDFARNVMKVAFAGQPVHLSDGATTVLPVGPHRPAAGGAPLTPAQLQANQDTVHRAWRLSHGHIRHALENGFYQGWDLHPAQLPVRFGACYGFFLDSLAPATERLRAFVARAARATRVGDVFDDAATGQGLLNFFLRALNCGAITAADVAATGLTLADLRSRSFKAGTAGRQS